MGVDEMIERIRAGETEVSTLIEQLAAEDPQHRKAASIALSKMADDSPEQLSEFGERLVSFLQSDDLSVRMQVSSALISLVSQSPELGIDNVSDLEMRLDDESPVVRKNVLSVLHITAKSDASAVEPITERIVDLLDSEIAAIRQRAVTILLQIGRESPTSLSAHVGTLVPRLDEQPEQEAAIDEQYSLKPSGRLSQQELDPIQRVQQDERIRVHVIKDGVALLLATIAETEPSRFEGHTDALLTHLDDERMIVRKSIAEIVGFAEDAGVVDAQTVVPKLVDQLAREPTDVVRGRYAWALGHLSDRSETARSAAAEAVEENLDLLKSDDVEVKVGVASLLAAVVDSHPEVVAEAHAEIVALLDDESSIVRQHAVYVLGTLDDDQFTPHLERVCDEDPEPAVAGSAADFLSGNQ
jgi:HEAT repeat protein